MAGRWRIVAVLAGGLAVFGIRSAFAQQANISTPSVTSGDSFFENFGVNFGYSNLGRDGGFFFNNGGGGVVPPFGGFDPNSGANFGLGGNVGGGRFFMNATASQGNDRSMVSQSPSVTLMNGQIGAFTDTEQSPFVTSIIPVVGDPVSPLKEKLDRLQMGEAPKRSSQAANQTAAAPKARGQVSTAATAPASSVAAIRRRQARESAAADEAKAAEIAELVARAEAAERNEKPSIAKLYYKMAAKLASGEQKQDLLSKAAANE